MPLVLKRHSGSNPLQLHCRCAERSSSRFIDTNVRRSDISLHPILEALSGARAERSLSGSKCKCLTLSAWRRATSDVEKCRRLRCPILAVAMAIATASVGHRYRKCFCHASAAENKYLQWRGCLSLTPSAAPAPIAPSIQGSACAPWRAGSEASVPKFRLRFRLRFRFFFVPLQPIQRIWPSPDAIIQTIRERDEHSIFLWQQKHLEVLSLG